MIKKKLSELTYEDIQKEMQDTRFHMPTDVSDAVRSIESERAFEDAKKELLDYWGKDLTIVVDKTQPWYDQVKPIDKDFIAAQDRYEQRKADWCSKYGCD